MPAAAARLTMTSMQAVRRGAAAATSVGLLGFGLAACSSTPAVCTDVDSVQATVHQLKNLELGKNTLSDLQKQLTKLSKQVRQLAADASSQYSAQITAVRSSLQRLQAGVSAAIANPSATSVSQLGTDAKALESSVTKLSKAVSSTC